jgi:hypothetical protein
MTSTKNIYQVDCRLYGGTQQQNLNASFAQNTTLFLNDENDISLREQITYLNDAAIAGFYAWSPLKTKDKALRIKASLFAVQGELQAFELESYSSGLAYSLSCSLHMALTQGWCEASVMPQIPYFCTGRVSASGEIGGVGEIINKVSKALHYISAQEQNASQSPSFYILLPKSNYDPDTQILTSENKSEESQDDWLALVKQVVELGGQIAGVSNVSEALSLILEDAFIASSKYGIEQEPLGLRAINYENRRHFFGRKLRVTELAESANKAYVTASALTVSGISGSGKSSLVQAGLLPELMREDRGLQIPLVGRDCHATIKPSEHNNLPSYLRPLLELLSSEPELVDDWLSQPFHELSGILINFIETRKASEAPLPYLVWILDQYEELFHTNHITTQEITHLSQFLREMAASKQILVISIVRLEYYSHSGVVAGERFTLLDQDKANEFQQILKEHQQFFGVEMASESELSNNFLHRQPLEARILGDVSHVPLSSLAFLLQKLYEKMKELAPSSGIYTHEYYDALLGIEGVMTSQAELALKEGLAGIPEALHDDLSDAFFEAFVSIDEIEMPIAKVVLNSHIENFQVANKLIIGKVETIWPLVNAFMSKGLISDCGNGVVAKLKLSHDSIIIIDEQRPSWTRMAQWFQANTAYLTWTKTIDDKLRVWLANDQANKFLITDQDDIKAGKLLTKNGHNTAVKLFVKTSAAKRAKRLGTVSVTALCFIAGISYVSYSVNDGYTKLSDELTLTQAQHQQEISLRKTIIELEIKSAFINHIANLGFYVPDEIVINNTDGVRNIIQDPSVSFVVKQQLLDALSNTEVSADAVSFDPTIIKDLALAGFEYDVKLVKKMPELYRLALETDSMDDEERQYWFNILPSITDNQVDRLFTILKTERQKLDALEIKYAEDIAKLNAKYRPYSSSASTLPDPQILDDLASQGFDFDTNLVNKVPQLYRLALESKSIDSKEKQYWFDILPSMTKAQINKLFSILKNEEQILKDVKKDYADVEQELKEMNEGEYAAEVIAENEKLQARYQELRTQSKGKVVPNKALREKFSATTLLFSENVHDAYIASTEILALDKDNPTWVSIDTHQMLGAHFNKQEENEKALEHWLAELALRDKLDIEIAPADSYDKYWNISTLYARLNQYEKAVEYSHIALKKREEYLIALDAEKFAENKEDSKLAHLWRNIAAYSMLIDDVAGAKKAIDNQLLHAGGELVFTGIRTLSNSESIKLAEHTVTLCGRIIDDNKYDAKMVKKAMASEYGNLSWYYLLANKPQKAMVNANKGLRLNPSLTFIKGNLAHAHLFLGNYDKALMGYKFNFKNKILNNKNFLDATLEDFTLFKEAGLTHPDLDRMIEEVSKFKI